MAQTVYATTADMSVPDKALAGIDPAKINAALARASSIADGYIRKAFQLPLKNPGGWTQSLTQAVADIATWIVMKDRGFNPDAENSKIIMSAYRDALEWLEGVSNKTIDPAFIDANGQGQDETSQVSTEVNRSFVRYADGAVPAGGSIWRGRWNGGYWNGGGGW